MKAKIVILFSILMILSGCLGIDGISGNSDNSTISKMETQENVPDIVIYNERHSETIININVTEKGSGRTLLNENIEIDGNRSKTYQRVFGENENSISVSTNGLYSSEEFTGTERRIRGVIVFVEESDIRILTVVR
jgi:hypothetical protein